MSWLAEPLQFGFMQTGLLAAALIGVMCACLGAYVVLRRMAFVGDALAHTTLPGLVVAYLNGWSLFGGAIVAGMAPFARTTASTPRAVCRLSGKGMPWVMIVGFRRSR